MACALGAWLRRGAKSAALVAASDKASGRRGAEPSAATGSRTSPNVRIVRIRWGDCDPAGIIFNPRLFEILDDSTAALFEAALGMTKRRMLEVHNCAGIAVVHTAATFHSPLRFGDDVAVESAIAFGRSSFKVEHRVHLGSRLCAEGTETRVWMVRDGTGALKGSPIPADVLQKFRPGVCGELKAPTRDRRT